jgi:hypothetical protein
MKLILAVTFAVMALATPAKAHSWRGHHYRHHEAAQWHNTWHQGAQWTWGGNWGQEAQPKPSKRVRAVHTYSRSERTYASSGSLLPHPEGCPRTAFCGCGAAVEIFGRPIRDLWLAANWFQFPSAAPGPGMVAVRQHHVMVIRQYLGNDRAIVYDANSGHHLTREHEVSLRGYSIRNPQAGRQRYARI